MSDAPTVAEPMTWSEVCERFPDQWIALVALDWADDHDEPFRTALVAGCGSRRAGAGPAPPPPRAGRGLRRAPRGAAPGPPVAPAVRADRPVLHRRSLGRAAGAAADRVHG